MLKVQPMIQYERSGSKDWFEPKYSSRITPDGKQMEIVLEVPVDASYRGEMTQSEGAAPTQTNQPQTINDDWTEMTNNAWVADINKPGRIAM